MNKIGLFVSTILFGLTAINSGAFAASALAWSPSSNATAEAHGYANTGVASQNAINTCNAYSHSAYDCEVVQSTYHGCIALATGNGHASWSAAWNTSQQAVNEALGICGYGCKWREWACN